MLKLQAIGHDQLNVVAELLVEGFPSRTLAFWQDGLKRLWDYNAACGHASIGNVLTSDSVPVGVLLTIVRPDTESGRRIVNLSSWYVREEHRWYAPRMLLAAISDQGSIYTDLTPSDAAVALNDRLGFSTFRCDVHLLPLPVMAIVGSKRGRLRALDDLPPGAVSETVRRDLTYHRDIGCKVMIVETDGKFHPAVFDVFKRKGIAIARPVYAESNDLIIANLAPIARRLIGHGVPLLSLRMAENTRLAFSWLWRRGMRYQVKGEWDARKIDELYSERALLKV